MIRIYSWDEKEFKGNGLAALINATDVFVERSVNGECTMSFTLPPEDNAWQYVKEEGIASLEGQSYRIKNINHTKVVAYPIYQDSCGHHIQSTGEFIGISGYTILEKLFEDVEEVTVLSVNEVFALGLEPICGVSGKDDLIDFFEQSKITPIGALKYLQTQLDNYNIHNELYFDNNKIALVKKLGADKGARIDLRLNAKYIKPTRDTTELITKLYPYGSGDMHIGSVAKAGYYYADGSTATQEDYCYRILNDGDQFIVSPYVDNYPIHEGHMSFDDIDDPGELLKMAARQFDKTNSDRIDIPKYTVDVDSLAKIGVPVGLGDIAEINDPQFKVRTKQRVVTEKYYPYEPQKTSVTVGKPEESILEMFGGAVTRTAAMLSESGKVKSSWLENIKTAYRTQINTDFSNSTKAGRSTVIHEYGDIWINPENSNQALAIIGGRLAIANGKTADGDWNWTAFGDWSGFTADRLVGGTIYTELIKLMGDGAKMTIENNMIVFSDNTGVRARWGYSENSEQYVFEMYDTDGNLSMGLDDAGNLRMIGILDTRKEVADECGYLIEGSTIWGQKYTEADEYINHGLLTTENEYGSHLCLYKDGTEHLHVRAYTTNEGIRKVAFAVNNTGLNTSEDIDSWDILVATEGDDGADTKMCGGWNVSPKGMYFYTGAEACDKRVPAGTGAITGSFIVKSSSNGTEFFYRLCFVNGLLMKIEVA